MEEDLENKWFCANLKKGVINEGIYTNEFIRFLCECEQDVLVKDENVFFLSNNDRILYLLIFIEEMEGKLQLI